MYESFFGLRERPFDLTPNPQYLVMTAGHREALSNLEYGIASRKGITLLIGDAGTGKTTVIRAAVERQPDRVHTVHLHNPALTRSEFIEMLAARFGLTERARTSKAALLLELESLLHQRRTDGETTVLIVDEAQSLPLELLEEIRLLANIETNNDKLLSVVIAGQPELADRLNDQALRQLKQRVALRCELRALSPAESLSYVSGRLRAAGASTVQLFTREAVLTMHEHSHGIPRALSVLADNALLTAFAAGERPVSRQTVLDVCSDFDAPSEGMTRPVVPATVTRPAAALAQAPLPINWANRILSIDTQPALPVASPAEPEGKAGDLFHSFWPKRRRLFSFFPTR